MGQVTFPHTLTNGQTANASQVMADLEAIQDEVNGNIDSTNLAASAVTPTELSSSAKNLFAQLVTTGKRYASGVVSVPFSSSSTGTANIVHGLGEVAEQVLVTVAQGGAYYFSSVDLGNAGGAVVYLRTHDGSSVTGSVNVSWLAIS
jgi:hypothetical protein